jgi:UDP-2,4-diacetamido-2,4,6-trideoxy-beta-L-altropyranose hydrolase
MTSGIGTLCVRADADGGIGSGHVIRCLALSQEWIRRGGRVVYVSRPLPEPLQKTLTTNEVEIQTIRGRGDLEDAEALLRIAEDTECRWLVIDGYGFDIPYQRAIREGASSTVLVDDGGRVDEEWEADILVNQNLGAESLNYVCPAGSSALAGSAYVLLRRAFLDYVRRADCVVARNVVVTLGGADPDDQTRKVIEALAFVPLKDTHLRVRVVIGANNPNLDCLVGMVAADVRLARYVDIYSYTDDMAGLLDWADIAVSAGGSTCWEIAYMGVPNLVIVTADNQRMIAEELDRKGVSLNLGWFESVTVESIASGIRSLSDSPERLKQMREKGRSIVDGQGARRLVDVLTGVS